VPSPTYNDKNSDDDYALIISSQAGDQRAFSSLMQKYAPAQLSIAWRILGTRSDAEEAVQDGFASFWLTIHRFDAKRALKPWITRIVINKCRDMQRKAKLRAIFSLGANENIDDYPAQDDSEHIEHKQEIALVNAIVASVSQKDKEVWLLVIGEDFSHTQAAQALKMSEKAVEMRLYRTRKKIKKTLLLNHSSQL